MSSYMLSHLCNLVASGIKTSIGFKKVHLNSCAKDLNKHFKIKLIGNQIANHIRTWKRKWAKINNLKKLSGVGWDEDNCVIVLDHTQYTCHVEVLLYHIL